MGDAGKWRDKKKATDNKISLITKLLRSVNILLDVHLHHTCILCQ